MTIRYEMLVKGATNIQIRDIYTQEYCCYGSIHGMLLKGSDPFKRRMFKAEDFQGIKLHLQWHSPYGQNTTFEMRTRYEKMFAELGFWEWLGCKENTFSHDTNYSSNWVKITRDKFQRINSITFKKDCPMYLLVAATGIWRLFSNSPEAHMTYLALKIEGVSPHAALCGAMQVYGIALVNQYDIKNTVFTIRHLQTHMPWGYKCMDVRCMSHLKALTHEDFKQLPSMFDEQKDTGQLSYKGRDNWFFGLSNLSRDENERMNLINSVVWDKKWGIKRTEKYSAPQITGNSLIGFCKELMKEARALKGQGAGLSMLQVKKLIKASSGITTTPTVSKASSRAVPQAATYGDNLWD